MDCQISRERSGNAMEIENLKPAICIHDGV